MSREIEKYDKESNELLKDKQFGDYFIFGDKLDTTWWFESQENSRNYTIQFVDNTEVTLTRLQLFSILNDRTFDNLNRERWTIGGLSPDNWKGTVREEEVYKDISLAKIYSASDEEE